MIRKYNYSLVNKAVGEVFETFRGLLCQATPFP